MENAILKDCVCIGAGVSGIALGRWLKHYNFDFVMLEKSEDIGGLWRYKSDGYGVMKFTHINVSKYNYCFSDFPFPSETTEFMHHKEIYDYFKAYVKRHCLEENIRFHRQVVRVEELKEIPSDLKFPRVKSFTKLWKVTTAGGDGHAPETYITPYVSVCSGHHAQPKEVHFPGQETFPGEIIHSVKFKSAKLNNFVGKRVLLVGIGNSSVDVAVNLVTEGECPKVSISTRSGSWILPIYINGTAIDLYPCRAALRLPWIVQSYIFETICKFIHGSPERYNLNPKSHIMSQHPTMSGTIMHHIQRNQINIKPNIKSISGSKVTFENGESADYDAIMMCTGYTINLDYLSPKIRDQILTNQTDLNLYKFMFHPDIGPSLSFIGYMQPATGGILPISEVQARLVVYTMLGKVKYPTVEHMYNNMNKTKKELSERYYNSTRHTLEVDPLIYNDEIAELFGAKPDLFKNTSLAWRLLFSSCGPAQWRLQGPDALPIEFATEQIMQVPVPNASKHMTYVILALLACLVLSFPLASTLLLLAAVYYFFFYRKNKKLARKKGLANFDENNN